MKSIKSFYFCKINSLLFFIVPFIFFLAVSCSQERRLAHAFLKSSDTTNILFLQPENIIIIKKNLSRADERTGIDGTDSASVNASLFLSSLKNITVTDLIYTNFIDEMKSRPFRIFNDSNMNAFMQLGTRSYIVKIAQIELDEFEIQFTASEQFDTLAYYEDFDLNTVSVNMWVEVTEVNGTQDTAQVLYSNEQISDEIEGCFSKSFSGRVEYNYVRTDIKIDKIYGMMSDFGILNAGYLFDYFLNKYIHEKYKGTQTLKYYHLDGQNGVLSPAGYNRYIFM